MPTIAQIVSLADQLAAAVVVYHETPGYHRLGAYMQMLAAQVALRAALTAYGSAQ